MKRRAKRNLPHACGRISRSIRGWSTRRTAPFWAMHTRGALLSGQRMRGTLRSPAILLHVPAGGESGGSSMRGLRRFYETWGYERFLPWLPPPMRPPSRFIMPSATLTRRGFPTSASSTARGTTFCGWKNSSAPSARRKRFRHLGNKQFLFHDGVILKITPTSYFRDDKVSIAKIRLVPITNEMLELIICEAKNA